MSIRLTLLVAAALLATCASARSVAIYGTNDDASIASLLQSNGHQVTRYGSSAPNASQLASHEVLIMLRRTGTNDISTWVQSGGLVITEWTSADWVIQAGLVQGSGGSGGCPGTQGVNFTQAGQIISQGVQSGFTSPNGTECWRNMTASGNTEIYATRNGNAHAIIGGASGSGWVFAFGSDWADNFGGQATQDLRQLILNMVAFQPGGGAVPASSTMTVIITVAILGLLMGGMLLRNPSTNN
jgi:hypothetical protein